MLFQNVGYGTAGNLVSQVGQRAENPAIAPIPILECHSDYQRCDLAGSTRSTRPTLLTSIVFLGNQLPMPSQQGFGCHDGCDLSQGSSPQLLGFGCETATLVIVQ